MWDGGRRGTGDWWDWDGALPIANVDVCHAFGFFGAVGSGDGGDGGWYTWDQVGVLESGGGTGGTGGAWETETVYTGA